MAGLHHAISQIPRHPISTIIVGDPSWPRRARPARWPTPSSAGDARGTRAVPQRHGLRRLCPREVAEFLASACRSRARKSSKRHEMRIAPRTPVHSSYRRYSQRLRRAGARFDFSSHAPRPTPPPGHHTAGQNANAADVRKRRRTTRVRRIEPQKFRIIHPFHPLTGREFEALAQKEYSGEHRVCFLDKKGRQCEISLGWTDLAPEDEPVSCPRLFPDTMSEASRRRRRP
jgi:hypothetical protein